MMAIAELVSYQVEFDLGHGWKIVTPQIQAFDDEDAIARARVRLLKAHPQFQGHAFGCVTAHKTGE